MVIWGGEEILRTPRLTLRTFRGDDLAHYAALNADPEVARWLGGPISRSHSDSIADGRRGVTNGRGSGCSRSSGPTTACSLGCAVSTISRHTPDDVEVAWRLAREYWDKGNATEAATAWLDHGFGTHGLPRIISITDLLNVRSLAVMQRLGMTFDHEAQIEDEGEVFDAVIYSITAASWRERRTKMA